MGEETIADQPTRAIVKRVSPINGQPPPDGWHPGQSGNPRGRPAIGLSIIEWLNVLGDKTIPEIRAIKKDKSAPASKLIAVNRVLQAVSSRCNASGNPIAGSAFDQIVDRTAGKAIQRTIDVSIQASFDASQLTPDELAQFTYLLGKATLPTTAPIQQLPDTSTSA